MRYTALAFVAAACLLSACGLRGDLERPVPLWGNPPDEGPLDPRNIRKADEEAAAKKAEEEAARAAQPAPTQPAAPQ
jgi:hypothetical protein